MLLRTLHSAIAAVKAQRGDDPATWQVLATCEHTRPATCDQIEPNTAGAIETPPFAWQNRGTYHQVVKLRSRR